jgi:hypothetical protein
MKHGQHFTVLFSSITGRQKFHDTKQKQEQNKIKNLENKMSHLH